MNTLKLFKINRFSNIIPNKLKELMKIKKGIKNTLKNKIYKFKTIKNIMNVIK